MGVGKANLFKLLEINQTLFQPSIYEMKKSQLRTPTLAEF